MVRFDWELAEDREGEGDKCIKAVEEDETGDRVVGHTPS